MHKMKRAVIGCGAIGTGHAERYARSPRAELVAVVDILPERAQALAARHHVPVALEDYRQLLENPAIQAVSVCLPNDLHAPVTLDCLRAGKHVLCEKPIALNLRQAEAMRAEARQRQRTLPSGSSTVSTTTSTGFAS